MRMKRWTRDTRLWLYFFGGPLATCLASMLMIIIVRLLFLGPDVGIGNYLASFFLLFVAALGIGLGAAHMLDPYESPFLGIAPLVPLFIFFIPEIATLVVALTVVVVAVSAYMPWLREKPEGGDAARRAG